MALKGGGVEKCGMTDMLVFLKSLYFSVSNREMYYIGHVCRFLCVEFLYGVRVLGVLARCCSLHGRSDIVTCSAVENVERLFERQ